MGICIGSYHSQFPLLFYQLSVKVLLQSEERFQTAIYARESHEGEAEERCSYHDDSYALHALRNTDQSLLLANAGKDNESQGKAESGREGVNHAL